MNFISSLEKKGVNFQSLDLPNSLNGSMKNFFTALLSLIAEYEHTRRAERQREGIEKIKMDPELRKLKYKGRKSYVSIIAKILPDYLDKKFSIKEICLLIGSRLHREHGWKSDKPICLDLYYKALKEIKKTNYKVVEGKNIVPNSPSTNTQKI